jgi:hypothetical protein
LKVKAVLLPACGWRHRQRRLRHPAESPGEKETSDAKADDEMDLDFEIN